MKQDYKTMQKHRSTMQAYARIVRKVQNVYR